MSYNLVERHSTGHIGGKVGGRENGGEDNHEYEVVGTSRSGLPSQQTGESSFGRGVGGNIHPTHPPLTATRTGGGGGDEVCMRTCKEDSEGQNWNTILYILNYEF